MHAVSCSTLSKLSLHIVYIFKTAWNVSPILAILAQRSISISLASVRKPNVFWRFQGVKKWNTGLKWVNYWLWILPLLLWNMTNSTVVLQWILENFQKHLLNGSTLGDCFLLSNFSPIFHWSNDPIFHSQSFSDISRRYRNGTLG